MTSYDPKDIEQAIDLVSQMKQDSGSTAQDNMGKIGAVANDVADTDQEIQDLEDKLKVKKDYKKHLSENAYSTVAKLSSTAEGVKALEEIMALNKSAVMPQTPTAVDSKPSLADLRMMMKDPRYWKDGEKDPTYISRVSKLFEAV